MGQIANVLNLRPLGALPIDIKRNVMEHVAIITSKSGKELNEPKAKKKIKDKKNVIEEKQSKEV